MTTKPKNTKNTKYTFTLLFPEKIKASQVTKVDFQVTGTPAIKPPLPQNKMPETFLVGDTLTFTYQKANPDVTVKSSLLTQYNVDTSEKEVDEDFIDQFDKPIAITDAFIGSWIFHLLGLYKYKGKRAAYYLDPELTAGP
ncbi:MAG: hypothetical protein Q7T48_02805 [Cellvibrio sp.]|uniref:hypothetical protein n=1 Tax=Cellvibrio sp. TaxID=1965322 RepID=UPI002715CFB5|nr:hypothetical protein [Cellvibrio sp.]